MKLKVKTFFRVWRFALGLLVTSSAAAQTVYAPVALTGFTDDVVANLAGPANQSANNDMDGGNAPVRYCFVTQNYQNPNGQRPTSYLPVNGLVTSAATPGLTFQLADYNSNNTLRIKGVGSGTLSFVTPRAARVLYLLGGAGNSQHGNTPFTATINFTDGTTQVFNNLFFTDWFGMLDVVAMQGVSRVNFDTNVIENSSTDPSLYQKPLTILPANYGKLIRSVSIQKPGTLATLNVLAISAGSGCTSAPAAGKTITDVTTICGPTPVNLSLSGSAAFPEITYQWQTSTNGTTWTNISGATGNTYTATPTQTTQFRARVLCGSLAGASTPVTVTLVVPTASLAYQDSAYCQLGQSDAPKASPAGGTFAGTAGLKLDPGTGTVDLENSMPGLHRITYTSTGLCPVTATDSIWIEASPQPLFPNIITANNDGLNDALLVKMPPLAAYRMRVFNRWGKLIWENTDQKVGWTGEKDGIYFYHVQLTDCAGKPQTFKGWVEVVR